MPRKRHAPMPPAPGKVAHLEVELSPAARRLHDEISERWVLHPAAMALLDLVCTSLSKAAEFEAIATEQGATIADGKGQQKTHPAATMAANYRSAAQSGLQKLMSHLGG